MLELKDVGFKVQDMHILNGVNLAINEGEKITIAGPSGSGKSTILKLCAKLISPTSGTITFAGQNIEELESSKYRKEVSYCFQQPVLFGNTAEDSFKFVYQINNQAYDQKRVQEIIASLELPQDILQRNISELSGGEKQRIALGRNVTFLPKVLLLDEVTTGLDLSTKDLILKWLVQLNANDRVTLVRVTHEEDEIKTATNIMYLKDGKLVDHE